MKKLRAFFDQQFKNFVDPLAYALFSIGDSYLRFFSGESMEKVLGDFFKPPWEK